MCAPGPPRVQRRGARWRREAPLGEVQSPAPPLSWVGRSCFLNSAPWCLNGEDPGFGRANSRLGPTVGRGSQGSLRQAACLLGPTQARAQVLPSKNSLFCAFPAAHPPAGPGAAATEDGAAGTQRHFTFCSRGVIPCPSREASGRTRGNAACSRPPGLPLADGQIPAWASLVGVLRAPSPVLGPLRLGPRGWSLAWTSRPQGRQSRLTPALGLPRGGGGCS